MMSSQAAADDEEWVTDSNMNTMTMPLLFSLMAGLSACLGAAVEFLYRKPISRRRCWTTANYVSPYLLRPVSWSLRFFNNKMMTNTHPIICFPWVHGTCLSCRFVNLAYNRRCGTTTATLIIALGQGEKEPRWARPRKRLQRIHGYAHFKPSLIWLIDSGWVEPVELHES